MPIIKRKSNVGVVTAAHKRIQNAFKCGLPALFAFSGGKDSICLANVLLEEMNQGNVDPSKVTVVFIDEEAIFDDVERIVRLWRNKFIMAGAKFLWLCLEFKHYNCFNQLTNDESFVCWDQRKKDVWIRQKPEFAIKSHKDVIQGSCSYQEFLIRAAKGCINMVGLRTAESVQRRYALLKGKQGDNKIGYKLYPIHDWSDDDVWLYIKEKGLDFPIEYLYMWQVGATRRQLRISQFFSVDTAGVLVSLGEYYPDLMTRVIRREPNAYLATLYWDSEMFRRSREHKAQDDIKKDFKNESLKMLADVERYFHGKESKQMAQNYKKFILKTSHLLQEKEWKRIYFALVGGDPKGRTLRGVTIDAYRNIKTK